MIRFRVALAHGTSHTAGPHHLTRRSPMKRVLVCLVVATLALPGRARAETLLEGLVNLLVDGGNNYNWERVALPGTQCGNGSQYKFFARRTGSPNVLFFFEGGGACWDYDTCSGRAGILG